MAGVNRIEDLAAWQLACELRDEIFKLTETGPASRDFDFRDQIRDASSSVARNLAEGFDLFNPRPFANHTRIARGSLGETKNAILDGRTKNYFSKEDAERLLMLLRRTRGATTGLLGYLESCKGEAPTGWKKPRR
jgi:four helix bundle protein